MFKSNIIGPQLAMLLMKPYYIRVIVRNILCTHTFVCVCVCVREREREREREVHQRIVMGKEGIVDYQKVIYDLPVQQKNEY
jgi:hypothetical protein